MLMPRGCQGGLFIDEIVKYPRSYKFVNVTIYFHTNILAMSTDFYPAPQLSELKGHGFIEQYLSYLPLINSFLSNPNLIYNPKLMQSSKVYINICIFDQQLFVYKHFIYEPSSTISGSWHFTWQPNNVVVIELVLHACLEPRTTDT